MHSLLTNPHLNKCEFYEQSFDFEALVTKTVENTNTIVVHAGVHRDITLEGFTVSEIFERESKK